MKKQLIEIRIDNSRSGGIVSRRSVAFILEVLFSDSLDCIEAVVQLRLLDSEDPTDFRRSKTLGAQVENGGQQLFNVRQLAHHLVDSHRVCCNVAGGVMNCSLFRCR